jgi:hypothetical protein
VVLEDFFWFGGSPWSFIGGYSGFFVSRTDGFLDQFIYFTSAMKNVKPTTVGATAATHH